MTDLQQGDDSISWRNDVIPVSTKYDDPYFSATGGLDETRHVFLAANDLPARFRPGFHVAELGFGTGLNLMATLIAHRTAAAAPPLHYTSFESFPLPAATIHRALTAFPEALAIAQPFLRHWEKGDRQFDLDGVQVSVIIGDVRDTLPAWDQRADAWYLDGFSPAKNPEMWSPDLMEQVARHTAPQGSFATYTAAGHVRRALTDAGFAVTRCPGHGVKRHMTRGTMT